MADPARRGETMLDWAALAEPYDHHLTTQMPIWIGRGAYAEPTPLETHRHQGMEVGVLLRGGMELRRGDHVISLEPGDVWLSPMWEPHLWRITKPQTADVVVVFLPEVIDPIFKHDPSWLRMFAVSPEERPTIGTAKLRRITLAIADELYEEAGFQTPGWEAVVRADLARLLITVWRGWEADTDYETGRAISPSATLLAQLMPAVLLAQSDMSADVSPEAAAAACGLSLSRFRHAFRQTMAMGFGQFRLRCRLAKAADMLLTTHTSIEDIAEKAGFADGSHLQRTFRKHYGITPAVYRQRAEITPSLHRTGLTVERLPGRQGRTPGAATRESTPRRTERRHR